MGPPRLISDYAAPVMRDLQFPRAMGGFGWPKEESWRQWRY